MRHEIALFSLVACLLLPALTAAAAEYRFLSVKPERNRGQVLLLERQEGSLLGFNRHCLLTLTYPDNRQAGRTCFPDDAVSAGLASLGDMELFLHERDLGLQKALAKFAERGFVPASTLKAQPLQVGFSWAKDQVRVFARHLKANGFGVFFKMERRGLERRAGQFKLFDGPGEEVPERLDTDVSEVVLLPGNTLGLAVRAESLEGGRREHREKILFIPLKKSATFFALPFPFEPAPDEWLPGEAAGPTEK